MEDELKNRYSVISDAEEGLSQVLLNAHTTTAGGQQRLNDIQAKIIDAVNNPAMSIDTPAGERSFLTFLHSQVGAINDLVTSGTLIADDQAKTTRALSNLYAVDGSSTGTPVPQTPSRPPQPADPTPTTDAATGGDANTPTETGVSPQEPMPDPPLTDVLGGDPAVAGPGEDPWSSLDAQLPGAAGGLGGDPLDGLGNTPFDGLGALAGAIAQLAAAAASQPGDRPAGRDADHDHSPDITDKPDDTTGPSENANSTKHSGSGDNTDPAGEGSGNMDKQPNAQDGTSEAGSPPPPLTSPASPTDTVRLPDGSSANARTPAAAQAVRAYLGGDTVDGAYSRNNLTLPPPGTPVTDPVDPSQLACGDVGVFRDHYVVALSSVKALANGQVVPLGSVASSPDFLGWIDPTATSGRPLPAPLPPTTPPSPTPDAPSDAAPPVAAG